MNDKFRGKGRMHDDLEGWKGGKFWLFRVTWSSECGTRLSGV